MKNIKKIAVLTSGGDAPGMNSAVRAVVFSAFHHNIEVVGIYRGYEGLIDWETKDLTLDDVRNINSQGGTFLLTSRSERFLETKYREQAAENLRANNVDALVAIGGDGTLRGAIDFKEQGVNVVCIPGTIDRDISCSEYTLGFDTAANTATEAIDKIRDSSISHGRCSVVEVMGRRCGDIALEVGIAIGASAILVPEVPYDLKKDVIDVLLKNRETGKKHFIIVVAEGIGGIDGIVKEIEAQTGIETRGTVLGHVQRGGSPTLRDRVVASRMGYRAVELLEEGQSNRVVVMKDNHIVDYDISEALAMKKQFNTKLFNIAHEISI